MQEYRRYQYIRHHCIVLRTSRFFPEEDDDSLKRDGYDDSNVKANEFLFRRVELEDVVSAHSNGLAPIPRQLAAG